MRLKRTPPFSVAWTIKAYSVASEARLVASLAASSRLPGGALRSSGRLGCFHVEIVTLPGYDRRSASGFQETSFGFLGFPERLGGQWRAEPLSLPVLGEFKIHTSVTHCVVTTH